MVFQAQHGDKSHAMPQTIMEMAHSLLYPCAGDRVALVHTREMMEVKRTSWANYGHYRRVYILLVSTWWLILESSNMTQRMTQPVLLIVFLLWWVIRTHHQWLKDDVSWVIPNTTHSQDDSHVSMPFHGLLTNQKMHVLYSTYSKILSWSHTLW